MLSIIHKYILNFCYHSCPTSEKQIINKYNPKLKLKKILNMDTIKTIMMNDAEKPSINQGDEVDIIIIIIIIIRKYKHEINKDMQDNDDSEILMGLLEILKKHESIIKKSI
jgi:hypothetical protein